MCTDSKCTNRKGINFHETERSWKQTSRRRIEKLTWNKNGCVTLILSMKCLRMFHPWEASMMLSSFVWFLSDFTCWRFETWKKILFEFLMKMLLLCEGALECTVAAEMVNAFVFPRTAQWLSRLIALMTTKSCVKIETRTDTRSRMYIVKKCQNLVYNFF